MKKNSKPIVSIVAVALCVMILVVVLPLAQNGTKVLSALVAGGCCVLGFGIGLLLRKKPALGREIEGISFKAKHTAHSVHLLRCGTYCRRHSIACVIPKMMTKAIGFYNGRQYAD